MAKRGGNSDRAARQPIGAAPSVTPINRAIPIALRHRPRRAKESAVPERCRPRPILPQGSLLHGMRV